MDQVQHSCCFVGGASLLLFYCAGRLKHATMAICFFRALIEIDHPRVEGKHPTSIFI